VEPQSEMVWHQAERYRVPRIIFVNKMDRLGASFEAVVEEIHDKLGVTPLVANFPVGAEESFDGVIDCVEGCWIRWDQATQGTTFRKEAIPAAEQGRYERYRHQLLEAVACLDDEILELFLAGADVPAPLLRASIRRLTLRSQLFPVLSGASFRNQGIQPLLDAIVAYLPAPDEVTPPSAMRPGSEETVEVLPDPAGPFLGLVFKTYTDRDRGRDCYIRIYRGTVEDGAILVAPRLKNPERVARLYRMHADKRRPIKVASAGDIVVASGLKAASTGDTLCAGEPLLLEGLHFPEPVVSASLEARSAGDEEKIQSALARLSGDDPTFRVKQDENTGQTIISGMGELHLQVLEERLVREFNLKVRIGRPQVTYRETIRASVEAESTYDRFTAGRQHFASVRLRVFPRGRSEGFLFTSALPDERIPAAMVAVIESACRDSTEGGIQFGYPVTDLGVELLDGAYNELTSTEVAYRIAAQTAFRDGCRRAQPLLLEPIMSLEIVAPREFVGSVMNNLAARRGQVIGTEMRDQVQVLRARAPLSQMFGYATDLRSASQGRATYSMLFSHYDEAIVPDGFVA